MASLIRVTGFNIWLQFPIPTSCYSSPSRQPWQLSYCVPAVSMEALKWVPSFSLVQSSGKWTSTWKSFLSLSFPLSFRLPSLSLRSLPFPVADNYFLKSIWMPEGFCYSILQYANETKLSLDRFWMGKHYDLWSMNATLSVMQSVNWRKAKVKADTVERN